MSDNLVSETIEVDAIGDGVTVTAAPGGEPGHKDVHVSPAGREADNFTLMIEADVLNHEVGISSYVHINHGEDRLEVIGYMTVTDRDEAQRIADALLAAFPVEPDQGEAQPHD